MARVRFGIEALSATPEEAARFASVGVQKLVHALSGVVAAMEISTGDVSLKAAHSIRPDEAPSNWESTVASHRAIIVVRILNLRPDSALAVYRAGVAVGASAGGVALDGEACSDTLETLRNRALSTALVRARRIAKSARGRVGALYRVKEDNASCGEDENWIISTRLTPDDSAITPPTHVRIQSGWLSESAPLRIFIEELGSYTSYGRGRGMYSSSVRLRPDPAFPPVTILPPMLYANGHVAIGFALTPADR